MPLRPSPTCAASRIRCSCARVFASTSRPGVKVAMATSNARAVAVMNEMARLGSCTRNADGACQDSGTAAFFAATTRRRSRTRSIRRSATRPRRTAPPPLAAVANANITETTALYQSSYNSGNWTGDLESFRLDVTTGVPTSRNWSAQEQLDRSFSGRPPDRELRRQRWWHPVPAVDRQHDDEAERDAGSADQHRAMLAGIINYLRGERGGETATPQKYRKRAHLLGDIVDAEPVRLGAPGATYNETIDAGYAAFKTARCSAGGVVFQGANDGMLARV